MEVMVVTFVGWGWADGSYSYGFLGNFHRLGGADRSYLTFV
jgi:hypothetical protein